MRYRAVDEEGDMLPANIVHGPSAALAAVHSRLRLLSGEWWEDRSLGFALPRFLFDGTRVPSGVQMLVNYITAYIQQTPGVRAVTNVDAQHVGRKLVYSCTIISEDGTIEGSVTGDVLLRAIS